MSDCEHDWHVDPLRVMVYEGEPHRLAACVQPGCFALLIVPHDFTIPVPLSSDPALWPALPARLRPALTAA